MSDYENDGDYFDVWSYVARLGCRIRQSSDPFFTDGDAVCQVSSNMSTNKQMTNVLNGLNIVAHTDVHNYILEAHLSIPDTGRR